LIPENNHNITRAITTEEGKKKCSAEECRRKAHHLHTRYLYSEQGERDVDPSSSSAS